MKTSEPINPAIVVVAYNRVESLRRLLNSISGARYPSQDIPLVISLDGGATAEVVNLASDFQWKYGNKEILTRDNNLGLKEHIYACGDLSSRYGSVIILEDDLLLSPAFYYYAIGSLAYFSDDPIVAGISLYSYRITENGFLPFHAHDDGGDNYFMQVPSSWGEIWTDKQWANFMDWVSESNSINDDMLPGYVSQWPETSWKKVFFRYLISTNKYFVYPSRAYSTNFGDPGEHTDRKGLFQVLLSNKSDNFNFKQLSESESVYDAWFEMDTDCLKAKVPALQDYDFTVDLNNSKSLSHLNTNFILSAKKSNNPILSYGMEMTPMIANIIHDISGENICLSKLEDLNDDYAIPKHEFYYVTSSIHEDIFDDIISKKTVEEGNRLYKSMKSDMEFNQLNPRVLIVTPIYNNFQNWSMIEKINSQHQYPNYSHVILNFTDGALEFKSDHVKIIECENNDLRIGIQTAIQLVEPEIIYIIRPGSILNMDALNMASYIFQYLKDVMWFNAVPFTIENNHLENLCPPSQFRYNRKSIARLTPGKIQHTLYFENVIFKRHIWEESAALLAENSPIISESDLWPIFNQISELYSVDGYLGSKSVVRHPLSLSTGKNKISFSRGISFSKIRKFLSTLLYPGYRWNVPLIRTMYTELNRIPPLIRHDKLSNSYYFEW
ncbi:MAG: hypothetical protein HN729_11020 [Candidatus Marinimicrobia bacterium]|jgi:hypothetical protein|nr:hypothetical protein [Candidatus Neomarinimicrobiota bacterium]MBT3634291.1 hypothetical protein [Candidatus Neomarinimicrobiota bacterium]MBT3682910.1 hypothetical protein [Candidatus Neomarinimicrobiota bacterium]MBT3760100.1 hypothetical protein [Candidatus Neomarinimicrobiota bacterium]MBT3896133.1 hypothetical protein [Candidatus Neomarinimicrobiota bacterium]